MAIKPKPKIRKKRFIKKKVCIFCSNKNSVVDYKSISVLRRYITEKGKIIPGRITGNCARHQRDLVVAVKRARIVALLPFDAA